MPPSTPAGHPAIRPSSDGVSTPPFNVIGPYWYVPPVQVPKALPTQPSSLTRFGEEASSILKDIGVFLRCLSYILVWLIKTDFDVKCFGFLNFSSLKSFFINVLLRRSMNRIEETKLSIKKLPKYK
jgi:hypothetical protein